MTTSSVSIIIGAFALFTTLLSVTSGGKTIRLLRNLFILLGILFTLYQGQEYINQAVDFFENELSDFDSADWYYGDDYSDTGYESFDEETQELYDAWYYEYADEEQMNELVEALYDYMRIKTDLFLIRNNDELEEYEAYQYSTDMDADDFLSTLYNDACSSWSDGKEYYKIIWHEDSNMLEFCFTSEPPKDSVCNRKDVKQAFDKWTDETATEADMDVLIDGIKEEIEADPYNNLTDNFDITDVSDSTFFNTDEYAEDGASGLFYQIELNLYSAYTYYEAEYYHIYWDEDTNEIYADAGK